jgi:hypothetical protein
MKLDDENFTVLSTIVVFLGFISFGLFILWSLVRAFQYP